MYTANDLARLALSRGDHERASLLLDESGRLAREQKDTYGLAWASVLQGWLWYDQGALDQARPALEAGLVLALDQCENELIFLGLVNLARILLASDRAADAARLLGAREAVRIGTNVPLLARDIANYEAVLADVRARLAPSAFAAAWEAGQVAPLRELVAGLAPG
jgi:hypothetical protein